jgi:hypothetical protein
MGVQSAVSTPSAMPGRRVTMASASGGSCTSQVDSTMTTSGLCDCHTVIRLSASTPRRAATISRFFCTAALSSRDPKPQLSEA